MQNVELCLTNQRFDFRFPISEIGGQNKWTSFFRYWKSELVNSELFKPSEIEWCLYSFPRVCNQYFLDYPFNSFLGRNLKISRSFSESSYWLGKGASIILLKLRWSKIQFGGNSLIFHKLFHRPSCLNLFHIPYIAKVGLF